MIWTSSICICSTTLNVTIFSMTLGHGVIRGGKKQKKNRKVTVTSYFHITPWHHSTSWIVSFFTYETNLNFSLFVLSCRWKSNHKHKSLCYLMEKKKKKKKLRLISLLIEIVSHLAHSSIHTWLLFVNRNSSLQCGCAGSGDGTHCLFVLCSIYSPFVTRDGRFGVTQKAASFKTDRRRYETASHQNKQWTSLRAHSTPPRSGMEIDWGEIPPHASQYVA